MLTRNMTMLTLFLSLLTFCIVGVIVTFSSLEDSVLEQSQLQHDLTSPILELVDLHLTRPLHISRALDKTDIFVPYLSEPTPKNITGLRALLKRMNKETGLNFFVASEKMMLQINSDSGDIVLDEESVNWYFELKDIPKDYFVDIGRKADPQLYIDIKEYDSEGNFIGFIGVFKDLRSFIQLLDAHRIKYGYELFFLNEDNQVVLSSYEEKLKDIYQPVMSEDIPWMKELIAELQSGSRNSVPVEFSNQKSLAYMIKLPFFEWKLLVIAPLELRQNKITNKYLKAFFTFIMIVGGVTIIIIVIFLFVRHHYQVKLTRDELSKIGNRLFVEKSFKKIAKGSESLCLVMADIDNFKSINDNFGHNEGDKVIQRVSNIISDSVRNQDIVGRWGGEEFVLIFPQTSLQETSEIVERIRKSVEFETLRSSDLPIPLSASFGITKGSCGKGLINLVGEADQALYKAKNSGKNKVEVFLG